MKENIRCTDTTHTPGPWTVKSREAHNLGESGIVACDIHHGDIRVGAANVKPGIPFEANARLIAAAPDLLASCEVACDEFSIGTFSAERRQRAVEFIRAAMKKAAGK